jgi:hypothetical protein
MSDIVVDKKETERKVNYVLRFVENNMTLKLVLDKITTEQDVDGFIEMLKESDFITLLECRKADLIVDNQEVLEALATSMYGFGADDKQRKTNDVLYANFPEYEEPDVPEYARLFNNMDALSDFIRRIIFLKRKELFKVGEYIIRNEIQNLAYYLNDLDNIEKLAISLGPEAVAAQIHNRSLTFYDGRKLKSIIGLPTDIISKFNDYHAGGNIHIFQEYIRSGRGNVDELRKMFDWIDALGKLSRKRKLSFFTSFEATAFEYLGYIIQHGCSVTSVINAVSREFMMYDANQSVDIDSILRTIDDTFEMQKEAGIKSTYISQNIYKWHWITARNCKLIKESRQEEYSQAVEKINQYSMIVDDYLFRCPETEKELFEIGNRYNNCLPIYRDKIIDNGAIIYSMYPVENGVVIDNMPPVTFEVTKDFDFIQVKTFNDADVEDPKILEVIKKWRQKARRKENSV